MHSTLLYLVFHHDTPPSHTAHLKNNSVSEDFTEPDTSKKSKCQLKRALFEITIDTNLDIVSSWNLILWPRWVLSLSQAPLRWMSHYWARQSVQIPRIYHYLVIIVHTDYLYSFICTVHENCQVALKWLRYHAWKLNGKIPRCLNTVAACLIKLTVQNGVWNIAALLDGKIESFDTFLALFPGMLVW